MNYILEKCPFCRSSASLGVVSDCDEWEGEIAVLCDNPHCGGAYIGERRRLRGGKIEDSFLPQDIQAVVDGWNNRGSAVVRGLIANMKECEE